MSFARGYKASCKAKYRPRTKRDSFTWAYL